jgi:hypothetical protein
MPYDEPDPTDPSVLVGVTFPEDPESFEDMAYALAEEYAALGYSVEKILGLFQDPAYALPHRAYRRLGEAAIRKIAAECRDLYERVRFVVRDAPQTELISIDPGD